MGGGVFFSHDWFVSFVQFRPNAFRSRLKHYGLNVARTALQLAVPLRVNVPV
jgi:hypothetical protein